MSPESAVGAPPAPKAPEYQKKDFVSNQTVRWCPGCGDYAILDSVQKTFAGLGIPREKFVIVSGIGCSSRFPYYMNTYGFHTIHGRAPAVATGLKVTRPDLSVWVVTGDGDALSIGGNHILHAMRRNVDLKVLLFNNRIYGLTKGQYSPTSEVGKKTKTTPYGSIDRPLHPLSVALAAEATLVARSADVYGQHLRDVLVRAAEHRGSAFIEILQNCLIFNDGAFEDVTNREIRDDHRLELVHGKPLVFGKNRDRGIRINGLAPEVVKLGPGGVPESELAVHDEHARSPALAYLLSQLGPPDLPTPIGVFRSLRETTYEEAVHEQIRRARESGKGADLKALLREGDTWEVAASKT
jgi:2-oxoglutarate/2-oxoacid ferredoxin oxidoreductase subunit beta